MTRQEDDARASTQASIRGDVAVACHPRGMEDLDPTEQECMRCHSREPMRFAGLCSSCRTALHEMFTGEGRTIEVAAYEPKMNVTPNAVALKDD